MSFVSTFAFTTMAPPPLSQAGDGDGKGAGAGADARRNFVGLGHPGLAYQRVVPNDEGPLFYAVLLLTGT
jgi:hypothetical protein